MNYLLYLCFACLQKEALNPEVGSLQSLAKVFWLVSPFQIIGLIELLMQAC